MPGRNRRSMECRLRFGYDFWILFAPTSQRAKPKQPGQQWSSPNLKWQVFRGGNEETLVFWINFFLDIKKNIFYRILFSYTFKKTLLAWIRLRVHLRFIQNEIKTMSRQCLSRLSQVFQDHPIFVKTIFFKTDVIQFDPFCHHNYRISASSFRSKNWVN